MIALRFLALFVAFFATSTVLRVSADDDEEVSPECTNQTEALINTTAYETAYAGIVSSFEAVPCEDEDDFEQCVGSLDNSSLVEFATTCTDTLGGQVVELENVRITCTPDQGMRTFTNVEMVPLCVGSVCTEDDISLLSDDFLNEVNEVEEETAGPGTCVTDYGGDFPASGALTVHPILVAAVTAIAGVALAL